MERALAQYTSALAHLPEPTARLDTYLFETRNLLQGPLTDEQRAAYEWLSQTLEELLAS